MTTGGRRGRRVLSWLLAIVLLGVVAWIVVPRLRPGGGTPALTTVTGVIGSEKSAFFADQRVQDVFRANGLDVRVDPAGSRQIATTVDLGVYDFAFPSSAPAADKLLARHPAARIYAPFSSPMAVATFAPIKDVLTKAGIVTPSGTFDMHMFLELTAAGTRWDQLPGNTAYPARKNVLLSTTEPCQSNSALMYLGIASYAANGDSVVPDAAGADKVLPTMSALFRDQGYRPSSTEVLFEDYQSAGVGKVPMAVVYEQQFLGEALSADSTLPAGTVLLYPTPTVFSRHTLVPLKPAGDRVGELLTTNPELVKLEAQFGFRTTDPRPFTEAVKAKGLPPPPDLIDVVEPPSYDTLESMLTKLGCKA